MAAHVEFTSFSAWPFLDSWLQLFYTMGVLVGIYFLAKLKDLIPTLASVSYNYSYLPKKGLNLARERVSFVNAWM